MTRVEEINPDNQKGAEVAGRDWVLLPLLGLLTIAVLACSTELIARHFFAESASVGEECMVLNRSSKSLGGIPNCVCQEKIPEGKLIQYRFNSSGYRSDTEFGPKLPGTFRIVVIGGSFAVADRVPIEVAFATTLSSKLSRLTGKKVEILNEGMAGGAGYPPIVALRFNEAIGAKPDLILRILTPLDVQHEGVILSVPPAKEWRAAKFISRIPVACLRRLLYEKRGLYEQVRSFLLFERTTLMLRHVLYESQSQYVKAVLKSGGEHITDPGFLRAEQDAEWKEQLLRFDNDDAGIEGRVKAAGVPLVTVLVPNRELATMISMGRWSADFDPFKLDNELRSIVTSHGGIYIDILPEFRNIPNAEQGYYPVEGHLNAGGHAIISSLLAKELTRGAVPALKATAQPQTPSTEENSR